MVTDTERSYTGTNFAVITLIVLLVMVGGYLIVAQSHDIADDHVCTVQKQSTLRYISPKLLNE